MRATFARIFPLGLAVLLGGCWTNHSSAGVFVRDVSLGRRGLVVDTCEISLESDHSLVAGLLSGFHGGFNSRTSNTMSVLGCSPETLHVAGNEPFLAPKAAAPPKGEQILDLHEPVKAAEPANENPGSQTDAAEASTTEEDSP